MQKANHWYAIRLVAVICALVLLPGIFMPASASEEWLPTREYNGRTYVARPASDLTAVLLIGYDHYNNGQQVELEDYAHGGQSDFLLLVVLDHEAKQIRMLHFDRDTITEVKKYALYGGYLGAVEMQLCLSHGYGKTKEKNNANAIWAVENLLGIAEADSRDGAGIDWYMAMDISGINKLNEVLGGVTVPIEDDFSRYDPTMVKGTTMRLTGMQAEYYCRYRYYINDSTNSARMIRQRNFMRAASSLLKEEVKKDANYARKVLNEMGVIYDTKVELDDGFGFSTSDSQGTPVDAANNAKYLMTSETLDAIVAEVLKVIDYKIMDVEYLPGEHVRGADGFWRYILEPNVAEDWAISVFYDPVQ